MKITLLKLSGKVLDNIIVNDNWINLVRMLKASSDALVIVHGAGKIISEWSHQLGLTPRFCNGLRVTDEKTMEVVAAVQSGLLNSKLVSKLQTNSLNAVGLTGSDYNMFIAEKINDTLGFVGNPVLKGEKEHLLNLLNRGVIPVFSSVCRNSEGDLMNINSDTFAKELSITIKADIVFFLSDVEGVLLNNSFKTSIDESDITEGIKNGQITEGMIPKLRNCIDLLNNGVDKVWIGNDLTEHIIKQNSYISEGITGHVFKGTWIVQSCTNAA